MWSCFLGFIQVRDNVLLLRTGTAYAGERRYIPPLPGIPLSQYMNTQAGLFAARTDLLNWRFLLRSPRVVQFETGMYQAYLFMEPGYHYQVSFPEYREKGRDSAHLPILSTPRYPSVGLSRTSLCSGEDNKGREEINAIIAADLTPCSQRPIMALFCKEERGLKSNTDSIIRSLESEFSADTSPFSASYRRFRYGVLTLNEG